MPISYCCMIANATKILLAEYPQASGGNNWMRVSILLTKLQKGAYMDHINIENNQMVTYVRTKHIIFTCFSVENDKESMQTFMENLIKTLKSQYIKLETLISSVVLAKFCQQTNVYPTLTKMIKSYNKDADRSSLANQGIIDEQEEKNEKLIDKISIDRKISEELSNNRKTYKIIIISAILVVCLVLIYGLISFIRCKNVLNLFCK